MRLRNVVLVVVGAWLCGSLATLYELRGIPSVSLVWPDGHPAGQPRQSQPRDHGRVPIDYPAGDTLMNKDETGEASAALQRDSIEILVDVGTTAPTQRPATAGTKVADLSKEDVDVGHVSRMEYQDARRLLYHIKVAKTGSKSLTLVMEQVLPTSRCRPSDPTRSWNQWGNVCGNNLTEAVRKWALHHRHGDNKDNCWYAFSEQKAGDVLPGFAAAAAATGDAVDPIVVTVVREPFRHFVSACGQDIKKGRLTDITTKIKSIQNGIHVKGYQWPDFQSATLGLLPDNAILSTPIRAEFAALARDRLLTKVDILGVTEHLDATVCLILFQLRLDAKFERHCSGCDRPGYVGISSKKRSNVMRVADKDKVATTPEQEVCVCVSVCLLMMYCVVFGVWCLVLCLVLVI